MDRPATGPSLLDHFAALEDPRQQAKVLYPLPEILLLLLCATLAGADDVTEVGIWGGENLAFLRRLLPYRHGIPSHDTLGEVIAALDPALFKGCFACWVEGLRAAEPDIIAVDGKTSRRTHARGQGRGPLHLVSAWATRQRLVLGQEAVAASRTRSPPSRSCWSGSRSKAPWSRSTPSARRREIATAILRRGGDYLLALKENRPATFGEVEAFFADPPPGSLDTFETTDGDHGRIEVRRHAVCHDVAWLFSGRRYPGEVAFPGLAMLGMVESETERGGKVERERRYYLSSATARRGELRPRGTGPLGHREPAALGLGCRLPRRSRPAPDRPRPREHGRGQAHGDEPAASGETDREPQEPPQARRLEHRLPRKPHPADRVTGCSLDCPERAWRVAQR